MQESQSKIISSIEPQKAIAAIANATDNTPIILDFDETLLLRNSTAEYINSLRPRLIGFLSIVLLKITKPWVWLPQPFRGDKTRDWFLVVVPTILLPWNLLLWQQKAKKLADDYCNSELISAVESNSQATIIVASLGFNFIIAPILQHIPMRYDLLVSCRFWRGAGDRNKGKLKMMREVLSESKIEYAVLVTDSEDDLPLLQVVKYPCFVLWSKAKYIEPFKEFWLYSLIKKIRNK